jgi:hypothetical protein
MLSKLSPDKTYSLLVNDNQRSAGANESGERGRRAANDVANVARIHGTRTSMDCGLCNMMIKPPSQAAYRDVAGWHIGAVASITDAATPLTTCLTGKRRYGQLKRPTALFLGLPQSAAIDRPQAAVRAAPKRSLKPMKAAVQI